MSDIRGSLVKVNGNVTEAAKPVSHSTFFIVSPYSKHFHFRVPGGVRGDRRSLRRLAMQRGRQAHVAGHVAGMQQLGRTTRPLHVQPLHSKCSTISGKALSSCTLPCRF